MSSGYRRLLFDPKQIKLRQAVRDAVFDNSLFVEHDSEDRGTHYHPNECRVCRVSIAQCICEQAPETSNE